MGRLFYSDSGRVVHGVGEELSRWRRARKAFRLPDGTDADATLHLYAHPHQGHDGPLHLSANGHEQVLQAGSVRWLHWQALPVPREHLRPGENCLELWSESAALDGWVLGVEGAPGQTASALSTDGGRTWRSEQMGVHHSLRGEYLIRLRLEDPDLSDPGPPAFVWESPDCPQLRELREIVPAQIQRIPDAWEKARALASWVSQQWAYTNQGAEYTPWDALTILSWTKQGSGQVRPNPIGMCVHYGVVFNSAALALGIPARSLCCTGHLAHGKGHFISEVWVDRFGKWCHVDANCDLAFLKDGVPLSVGELYPERERLPHCVSTGPGFEKLSDYLHAFVKDHLLTGDAYRLWSVWPRNDFFGHPECTPPAHGASAYCEADWVWSRTPDAEELAMFPHRVDPAELMRPPDLPAGAYRPGAE